MTVFIQAQEITWSKLGFICSVHALIHLCLMLEFSIFNIILNNILIMH